MVQELNKGIDVFDFGHYDHPVSWRDRHYTHYISKEKCSEIETKAKKICSSYLKKNPYYGGRSLTLGASCLYIAMKLLQEPTSLSIVSSLYKRAFGYPQDSYQGMVRLGVKRVCDMLGYKMQRVRRRRIVHVVSADGYIKDVVSRRGEYIIKEPKRKRLK